MLADPSAAISLLWMRRSLQFLAAIMRGVADDRKKGDPVSKIAKEAYAEHLEPYHGWLLKNTFAAALSAPSRPVGRSKLGQLEEGDVEAPLRVGASPPSEEEVARRPEAWLRLGLA